MSPVDAWVLTVAAYLVELTPEHDQETWAVVGVLAQARDVHAALAALDDARVEADKARKKAAMMEGARSLKASRAALTTNQVQALETNLAPAESRRHLVHWVELAVAAREQSLEALARARASQAFISYPRAHRRGDCCTPEIDPR